jgi:CubicO group peptidase (beta-lactamase class C family)
LTVKSSVSALLLALVACRGGGPAPDTAQHIAEIESRLLPHILIRGESLAQRTLPERMAHYNVPGVSVAVIEHGKIAWAKAWGMADVAAERPVTPATLFQAASISKPVAATAALTLVQDGRVELDTDVNRYLTSWQVPANDFTRQAPVTLRRILTHSAGFTVHGFPGYARSAAIPTAVDVLDGKGNTAPVRVAAVPGAGFSYSGGGYTVMQQLLADVTGQPFAQLMQQRVLGAAGMRRSTYDQPLPESRWDEAATGYRANGDAVEEQWHVYPEQAAAGLWTTPTDLATWALAIQRAYAGGAGEVLAAATARQMLTPDEHRWGLGPGIGEDGRTFRHDGSNEGSRCDLVAFLDGSAGVVVMTNSDRGSGLIEEIVATVAASYDWPILQPPERVVARLDPAVLEEMAGSYDLPGTGVVRVAAGENRLIATLPGDARIELLPESPTVLFDRDDGARVTVVREGGHTVGFEVRGERARRVK